MLRKVIVCKVIKQNELFRKAGVTYRGFWAEAEQEPCAGAAE